MNSLKDTNIHLENRHKSRVFFVFLFVLYAFVCLTKNSFNSAMAAIVSEGIFTKSQTGLISAVFYLIYAPLQIVAGLAVDKYNPERLVFLGLVGSGLCNAVIYFFNTNYYIILAVWSLNAVFQFAIWPGVFKIMSSQLVRSDRKTMIFLMSFSTSAGFCLGYIVAAFVDKWQTNFIVSALSLFVLAIILIFVCKKSDPFFKADYPLEKITEQTCREGMSVMKLFLLSGFFVMLPVVVIRYMIQNGTNTLSAVMLMESYERISPSIGNILNVFIIISGVLGTIFAKAVIYPKFIGKELRGHLFMSILSIPFVIILYFVGTLPSVVIVLSLCMISVFLNGSALMLSYYNLSFIRWGRNGTAAGISNAASAVGAVLQSYGFAYIAERASWSTVGLLWIVMLGVANIFNFVAAILAKKFFKKIPADNLKVV